MSVENVMPTATVLTSTGKKIKERNRPLRCTFEVSNMASGRAMMTLNPLVRTAYMSDLVNPT